MISNNEKLIKPVALSIVQLCLVESINLLVRKLVGRAWNHFESIFGLGFA